MVLSPCSHLCCSSSVPNFRGQEFRLQEESISGAHTLTLQTWPCSLGNGKNPLCDWHISSEKMYCYADDTQFFTLIIDVHFIPWKMYPWYEFMNNSKFYSMETRLNSCPCYWSNRAKIKDLPTACCYVVSSKPFLHIKLCFLKGIFKEYCYRGKGPDKAD